MRVTGAEEKTAIRYFSTGKGSVLISANEEVSLLKPTLYPNPGTNQINIVLADGTLPDGHGIFYSLTGSRIVEAEMNQGVMSVPEIPAGVYVIEIRQGEEIHYARWSKI